jgi:alkylation response protein AidB-like acyl-CoA dehydrogenase
MVDFHPSVEEAELARRAAAVAREVVAPRADAHDAGVFPSEAVRALAEAGLMAIKSPARWGGGGASQVGYVMALREVAAVCGSAAVTMAVTNMTAEMIAVFGSDDQRERWLRPLASGAFVAGAFALSEPSAGSDAASLACAARRADDGAYVLDGKKAWITSGDRAGVVLTMARTGGPGARGISAFLVDPAAAGFSVLRHEQKMGLRGSSTVGLALDGVRVPAADRLGDEGVGFRVAMTALDGGRCGIGAQAIGIAQGALAALVRGLGARRAGDRAGGLGQPVDFRVADMATRLDAAWLLVLRASQRKDAGLPVTREAAMAKVFATEAANWVCQRALELATAHGLADAGPLARALRDVRVSRIYEGTSEVQRLVIARELIAGQAA